MNKMRALAASMLPVLLFSNVRADAAQPDSWRNFLSRQTEITQEYMDSCRKLRREYRDEMRRMPVEYNAHFGIAGSPTTATDYFANGSEYSSLYSIYDTWHLSSIYGDYYGPITTTGTLIAGIDIKISSKFAFCLDLGMNCLHADRYNGISEQIVSRTSAFAIYLLPVAKFYYLDRQKVKLYGSAALGAGKYFNYPKLKYGSRGNYVDRSFRFENQFVPIGAEFGNRLLGFVEFGFGTIYSGMQAGVGYRF